MTATSDPVMRPAVRGRREDVVIVGGGPAGASAACLLARAGRVPLLIERDREPRHRICGEFLSIEAQAYLAGLGIDVRALGGAPIPVVRLTCGREVVEAPLPFEGVGLTRRTLDEALLRRAAEHGARILRGPVVRTITGAEDGLRIGLRGGQDIEARTVFLATGKHDLHEPRRSGYRRGEDLIGFKTYFALSAAERAALGGAVEIVLFEGGYAGLQPVEGGAANLCLLVRRDVFEAAGAEWNAFLRHLTRASPHLRARLDGARPLLRRPLAIAHVPYGFLHRAAPEDPDGLFRLGDQMGVIPSFSGDGISIAMHSAEIGAAMFLEHGNAAAAFHRRMRTEIGRPIRLASMLYALSRGPLGRGALLAAFRLYPGILSVLAARTRLPPPRLAST